MAQQKEKIKEFLKERRIRKILVSVKFLSAILGPEVTAPILWAPRKMRSFCRKNHVPIKFRVLGGGGYFGFWGGGRGCRFDFYGREDFGEKNAIPTEMFTRQIRQNFQQASTYPNMHPPPPVLRWGVFHEGVRICVGLFLFGAHRLSCTWLRVPPVALHVSQLISWIL